MIYLGFCKQCEKVLVCSTLHGYSALHGYYILRNFPPCTAIPPYTAINLDEFSTLHYYSALHSYSRVPNKRPRTRIYFPKNASLYGPYLALYVYLKKIFFFFLHKMDELHILATQFLRKATNSPNLVVNKSW